MIILSIDIGTSNIKSMLSVDNKVYNQRSIPVSSTTNNNYLEQNPELILNNLNKLIQEVLDIFGTINRVILSTAMHTLIFLDKDNNLKSNMYLWSDTRAESVLNLIPDSTKLKIYKKTGTPVHSMSPLAKLLYFKEQGMNLSELKIADLKSYLFLKLTGVFATDMSNASSSGLWNMHTKNWDNDILSELSISETNCAKVEEINYEKNLLEFPSVILTIGSTDGVMANRGMEPLGAEMVISGGTSIGIRYLSDEIEVHDKGKTFCYYAGFNKWLIGSASNNGGNVYNWIKQSFYDGKLKYTDYINIVFNKPLTDLIVSPYIFGERGPWWSSGITFRLKNLREYHQPDDYAQSITLSMLANISLIKNSLVEYNRDLKIILTGGLFSEEVVVQYLSKILKLDLRYIDKENAVCIAGINLYKKTYVKYKINFIKYEEDEKIDSYISETLNFLDLNGL